MFLFTSFLPFFLLFVIFLFLFFRVQFPLNHDQGILKVLDEIIVFPIIWADGPGIDVVGLDYLEFKAK